MLNLKLKPSDSCRYDLVTLGEVMLRLDPGEGRIRTARSFRAWEGGGEYNVARGLKKCFGLKTAVVTALARNEVGALVEDLIQQGGVDSSLIKWMDYDGVGRSVRNGLNFTERGYGVRGALGVSDRGHTAASQLKKGDIDWEEVFKVQGTRWFHTGGIYAALSESTPDVLEEAMSCAQKNGVLVSYDLNYRPSLWKSFGGQKKACEVNRRLAKYVDVMIGNEEDFVAAMGFTLPDSNPNFTQLKTDNFKSMIKEVIQAFPHFKVIATTLRTVKTATVNDWSAIAYAEGEFAEATQRESLEILDRVGGGDSFASGLIYGLLNGKSLLESVNYGAAHGALAMTTPGDTSMATLGEVEKLLSNQGARVDR